MIVSPDDHRMKSTVLGGYFEDISPTLGWESWRI